MGEDADLESLDRLLMEASTNVWKKAARVVGEAMLASGESGAMDNVYFERLLELVHTENLEGQGFESDMKFYEVRLYERN